LADELITRRLTLVGAQLRIAHPARERLLRFRGRDRLVRQLLDVQVEKVGRVLSAIATGRLCAARS
jgi:hypothetical protein